jgi:hypothetical protein
MWDYWNKRRNPSISASTNYFTVPEARFIFLFFLILRICVEMWILAAVAEHKMKEGKEYGIQDIILRVD